jgi:cathepsin L
LVGYGTDDKWGDYWILKNSYGKNFGENGFIKISREIPNFCGLWEYVTFPLLDPI